MSTFKLPELGEGIAEGEIVSWKVAVGDSIKADTPMVEVMTDKATIEVPAPRSGTVKKLFYKPGDIAKVGAPLIEIEESATAGAAVGSASKPAASETHTPQVPAASPASQQPAPAAQSAPRAAAGSQALASPAVRKMAREMSVDLSHIQGSGERGRVLRSDLVKSSSTSMASARTAGRPQQQQTEEERIPFLGIRRKIADHLTESAHKAVHFSHFDEVDFTEIIKLREEANAFAEKSGLGVKLTYLPFFIKGAISAIKKFPILNSSLDESRGEILIKHYYHFGISVQTDHGLMVAVVRDCDQKDIYQLAREIKEVSERARSGKASLQDLTGSTITITNPGSIGGLYATPVINYPESVILGMYQIKKRPVVKEINGQEMIVSRPMMYTNITCDHRIVDGAIAAGYLRLFCEYMESPARMAFV